MGYDGPAGRLELTWTNKHLRLIDRLDGGYDWVEPTDRRVAEVRLLADRDIVGEVGVDRAGDNLVVQGDALAALRALTELPEFAPELVGKVRLIYVDPPFNTGQSFTRKTPSESIVYRYPLAEAIADRLVKTPVIVGRSDDLADDATKLRDGLTLLRAKQRAVDAWVAQSGLPPRNLLMLVVAQSIEEAESVEASLTADTTFEGAYAGAVLRIDSSQPDEALEALERVEETDSPVRVIVSVQMLQEGWDVATVAVIVSLRCFVVEVKADRDLEDAEVVAKHEAAVRWAARVNADGVATPDEWHVLLAGETVIREARGSWPQLLQRGRTDLG